MAEPFSSPANAIIVSGGALSVTDNTVLVGMCRVEPLESSFPSCIPLMPDFLTLPVL